MTDELNKRIDREVRQLIGDLQMQVIVLRTALEMMQPLPKQPEPAQPPVEPPKPEPKEPEEQPEPLRANGNNGGSHIIRG
jgi:hypothetical protein